MSKNQNQLESELLKINKLDDIIGTLVSHFSSIHSGTIQRQQIFEALFILLPEKYEFERIGDLWDIEIEYNNALKLLSNFNFNTVLNKIETTEEIILEDFLMEFKVRIKSKGLIWVIHKYDADPFPSNPHAHQIDNNIKLDLSNGNCYRMKKYLTTIKKKDLLLLREDAAKVFKGELPPLAI